MIVYMRTLVWVGYLLQVVYSNYSDEPAIITDCVTQSSEPVYAEGETFQLCCALYLECRHTSFNDSLILAPLTSNHGDLQEEGLHNRTGRCSVEYTVKKAKVDVSQFRCYRNDPIMYTFAVIEVHVIEKPRDLRLEGISVSENYDIYITLSYKSNGDYDEDVRILMEEPWSLKETELCHEVQCLETGQSKICTCQYHNGPNRLTENRNVTLKVHVKRSWSGTTNISSEIEHSVNWIDFVRPDPVMELALFNISSDDVILTFRVSRQTRNLIRLMAERNQTFVYHVTLINSLRPVEKLYLNLTDMNPSQSNVSIAVRINELTPFTRYNFSVYCSGGGGAGEAKQIEFITGKSVPLHPPQVEHYIYTRPDDGASTSASCIGIILQPLDMSSRGGDNFHYRVELTSEKGYYSINSCLRKCQICRIPPDTLRARVWSANEIGQSRNHTELVIPGNKVSVRPRMLVEEKGTNLQLTIRMPRVHEIDNITVVWCSSPSTTSTHGTELMCYDSPQKVYVSPENPTTRVQINLHDTYEKLNTTHNTEDLLTMTIARARYFYFDDVTQTFGGATTAQVSRTKGKPRFDLTDSVQNMTSGNLTVKLFLSVQEKGQWLGMVEADCYFHFNSGLANVQLSIFYNDTGTALVRFHQQCSRTPQFMAKNFEIYNSSDDKCLSANKITEVAASLRAIFYELPQDMMFVCVVAVGENRTVKSLPSVLLVNTRRGEVRDGDTNMLVAVVAGAVLVIIVVLFLSLIIFCVQRGQCKRAGFVEFIQVELDARNTTEPRILAEYEAVEQEDGMFKTKTEGNGNANISASDYLLMTLSSPNHFYESDATGTLRESCSEQESRERELSRVLNYSEYGRTNLHFVRPSENCARYNCGIGCNCTNEIWNCKDSSKLCTSGSSSCGNDIRNCTTRSNIDINNSRNCTSGSSNVIKDSRNCTSGSDWDTNDSASRSSSDISSSSDSTPESSICTVSSDNREPSCGQKLHSAHVAIYNDGYIFNQNGEELQNLTFQAPGGCGECCSDISSSSDSTAESSICTVSSDNREPSCGQKLQSAHVVIYNDDYISNQNGGELQNLTFHAPGGCKECCSDPSIEDDSVDLAFYS